MNTGQPQHGGIRCAFARPGLERSLGYEALSSSNTPFRSAPHAAAVSMATAGHTAALMARRAAASSRRSGEAGALLFRTPRRKGQRDESTSFLRASALPSTTPSSTPSSRR